MAYVDDIIRTKLTGIPDDLKRRNMIQLFYCSMCGLSFKVEESYREHMENTGHAGNRLKRK